ncbi:DUF429 domain-containing protein [Paradesulfitobacterium ferrireducens]|uniref:DUF429 domain-containing protein n=1 Tax=Paradesulfitobacterium ferrireducens TaxID=2816476 RepID=UPI001A90B818|nr:DUF429 domain-containing protein [Paradesulfitobacterium ferrireducens]
MFDYILTYSKIKFYPLEPVKEDIKIEDIAHSLSLMTRANGHCSHFYSVAQHSVNCCQEAKSRGYSERVQLGCLLHDASESYISDLTRPVKRNLPEYFAIEEKLQSVIYDRFGLDNLCQEELKQIEEVDDALLHYEFEELMDFKLLDAPPKLVTEHDFSQRDFGSVKKEFLAKFNAITRKKTSIKCVGIDGCKGGWVVVTLTDTSFEINMIKNIGEVFNAHNDYDSVIVDMPIGLPESTTDVRPDGAVRSLLKGKASSIFNTPCRQAVYANSYDEANEINKRILGKGLSKQSYAICGKIKEIDKFVSDFPEYKNHLVESHPELCFAMLNSGEPIYDNKHTYQGARKRIELLSRYYDKTEEIISYANNSPKLMNCLDDVIDALCMAVTGMIAHDNLLKTIPENPMMDKQGILMQMVYAERM